MDFTNGVTDRTYGQWARACNTAYTFPYNSDTYQPATCNGADHSSSIVPVASMAGCATSAGVFDLSGNVSEWIDAHLEIGIYPVWPCGVLGGSYKDGTSTSKESNLTCGDGSVDDACTAIRADRGFRCCSI
jgi:formylglycine-generating enzyme required for sulfatase activity